MSKIALDAALLTRRKVLAAGAAACISLLALPKGSQATAEASSALLKSFLELSRLLTGHEQLDEGFAQRILDVMAEEKHFTESLAQLLRAASAQAGHIDGLYNTLKTSQPALAALSQDIMKAWYLGIVGKGPKTQCVAYQTSLAQQAVKDYIRPPTYAYGGYGTWAESPLKTGKSS